MIGTRKLPFAWLEAFKENASPDVARGIRATLGMVIPLLLAETGRIPLDLTLGAIAAQSLAMVDLRGSYSLRLAFLFSGTMLYAISAVMGGLAASHLWAAVLCTVFIAVVAGGLRHLSAEYGAALAAPVTLIYLVTMSLPVHTHALAAHAGAALAGGALAVVLQMALWPFRPQHPLRAATAECWLAAADLVAALNDEDLEDCTARNAALTVRESRQRETLDRTLTILQTAGSKRMGKIVERLERLHLLSAQISTRAMALQTMVEAIDNPRSRAKVMQSFQPMLRSLENLLRSAAITLVSRQPAHLAAFDVRLRRLASLIGAARGRVLAHADALPNAEPLVEILGQLECLLPVTKNALRETIDRANERGAFSLELTDLHTWKLGSLGAALNLSPRLDRALLRFIIRFGVVMVAGVFLYRWFDIPHGYWLPLTFVVVMQPDYGSTRQRAAERVFGTVTGSALASLVLFLSLPHPVLIAAVAGTTFLFAYFLKRRYGIAVIFVTLMVVLLTEIGGPVTWSLTVERVGCTLAGGILALLAAHVFWPSWERDRFQPILSKALLAAGAYLDLICLSLKAGTGRTDRIVAAKRSLDTANVEVFASLRRMYSEPRNAQESVEESAALANGNQRLTRLLHLLLIHLTTRPAAIADPLLERWQNAADAALSLLAQPQPAPEKLRSARAALEEITFATTPSTDESHHEEWVFSQCSRATTEISAMLLAAEQSGGAR
ncbi:MAG: FUSC family protein [Chthoniobacteraceae bacterium]